MSKRKGPDEPAWMKPFRRGMQLGTKSDFPGAEGCFREAISLAPEEPYPHYELGYTLSLMRRHSEALVELKRTEELARGFFLVQTEILICEKLASGEYSEELAESLRMLQGFVESGADPDESAIGFARSVVEAHPECALAHYHLGKLLMKSGSPDEAEAWLRGCVELGADETTLIDTLTHLGILARRAGDEEEARLIWAGLLEKYEGNPHLHLAGLALNARVDPEPEEESRGV